MKNNTSSSSKLLGIFALFTLGQAALLVNPALASLASQFPDIPYSKITLLSTSISVAAVPACTFAGNTAGKKMKYQTLAIAAALFIIIPGTAAYFISSFYGLLAMRLLVGIGIGLIQPIGNAIIVRTFHGQKAAQMQGIGNVVVNLSSILYQLAAGWVCVYNPSFIWLIHLVLLIPLGLMILFLEEPAPEHVPDKRHQGLPIFVYLITALCTTTFMCFYPLITSMSALILTEGLGNTAIGGITGAMFTVGGLLIGILFPALYRRFEKNSLFIGHACWLFGMLLFCAGHRLPWLVIGTLFCGFGFYIVSPATLMYYKNTLPEDKLVPAVGLFSAASNLGSIFSSFFCSFMEHLGFTAPRTIIQIGFFGVIVSAILWLAVVFSASRDQ